MLDTGHDTGHNCIVPTPPSAPGGGARHLPNLHFPTPPNAPCRGARHLPRLHFSNTSECTRWRSQKSAKAAVFQRIRTHQMEEPELCQNYTFPTPPITPGGGARHLPKLHCSNTSERTRRRSQTCANKLHCSNTSVRTRWWSHKSAQVALLQHIQAQQVVEPGICPNCTVPTPFRWRNQKVSKLHCPNTYERTRWRSQKSANTALPQHFRAHQAEEPNSATIVPGMCQNSTVPTPPSIVPYTYTPVYPNADPHARRACVRQTHARRTHGRAHTRRMRARRTQAKKTHARRTRAEKANTETNTRAEHTRTDNVRTESARTENEL